MGCGHPPGSVKFSAAAVTSRSWIHLGPSPPNNSFKPKTNRYAILFGLTQALGAMDSITADLAKSFSDLPAAPPMSLRGGNAVDDYEAAPAFDPVTDQVTPEYLEAHFWGIPHLDSQSWRFYLPHLLSHALQNISNPGSNATDTFLFSLRPPDRDPPRFGSLSGTEEQVVAAVLDKLAFSEESVWKEQAMIALEEYWAPGATYR